MAGLGNMKLKIAIDSSEVNAFVRVMCSNTLCMFHGSHKRHGQPGLYCERKHIEIGDRGECKDYRYVGS